MSEKIFKIGLVQINAAFEGQSYMPLSVAQLWSYFREFSPNKSSTHLDALIYKRDTPESIVHKLSQCDLVGFSLYTWNEQISLETMRVLRHQFPDKIIVCGGPQVPDVPTDWLKNNTMVDVTVHGEGEVTFQEVIDAFIASNRQNKQVQLDLISGITFRPEPANLGKFTQTMKRERMKDLNFPSPFLDGTFDLLLKDNPEEVWMALWETNRGCPFSCTFCDWGSAIAAKVGRFDIERLEKELIWIAKNSIEFVFTCDANFGLLPRDLEIAQKIVETVNKFGYPKRISTQGAKNVTDRSFEVQKILAEVGVANGATLAMQSLDPTTLKAIKRDNISLERYFDLQKRYRSAGIPTYVDLILGLPGETLQSFKKGVGQLILNGEHDHIQFNNLSLLPNAEMNSPFQRATHGFVLAHAPVMVLHGRPEQSDGLIDELQDLVVGTKSMPPADWVEARSFAWLISLVHLNKLCDSAVLLTHAYTEFSYDEIVSFLLQNPKGTVLSEVIHLLRGFAKKTQTQGEEYFRNKKYLDINWTADEYAFIDLVSKEKLLEFIQDVQKTLQSVVLDTLDKKLSETEIRLINNAYAESSVISYNSLILPSVKEDFEVTLSTNLLDITTGERQGQRIKISNKIDSVRIIRTSDLQLYNLSFEDWCRYVVWYRNKRGAYNYETGLERSIIPAGHFR